MTDNKIIFIREALVNFIKTKLRDVKLIDGKEAEDTFLQSIWGDKNSKISIANHTFNVKYKEKYIKNKFCDVVLLENNHVKVWIEGKREVKLLPINCRYIPEEIIFEKTSFLDIARLIALVRSQNDLRFTLSTVKEEVLEYYKRRNLSCTEIIKDDEKEVQVKSEFICKDILPVENDRKRIVELFFKAILDSYFFKLSRNGLYVTVSFIEDGVVFLKVYRDIEDPSSEGKMYCYGVKQKEDGEFLSRYFPSS